MCVRVAPQGFVGGTVRVIQQTHRKPGAVYPGRGGRGVCVCVPGQISLHHTDDVTFS